MNKYATDAEIDVSIQVLRVGISKVPEDNPFHHKLVVAINHTIWMLEECKDNNQSEREIEIENNNL